MNCSFQSLVDDALRRAFELTAIDDIDNGVLNSLKLSHISQRCRLVALSTPVLWTHIRHEPELLSTEFVEACLERSGGLPLSIIVTMVLSEHVPLHVAASTFLTIIREKAADRCRSFRSYYLPRPVGEQSSARGPYLDPELWVGDGVFPEVQVLDISFPLHPRDNFFATTRWSHRFRETPLPFPKLRQLSVRGLVPIDLNGYNDLVKLDCTCDYSVYLPESLSSCVSLQDLRVTLFLSSDSTIQFMPQTHSLPTVRNFRFDVFIDGHLQVNNALKHIFSCLVFPNLSTFKVHIKFLDEHFWRYQWDQLHRGSLRDAPDQLDFGQYLKEIILEDNFPVLETLWVSLAAKFHASPAYESATFAIPVHLLPNLNRVELQSDLLLSPGTEDEEDSNVSAGRGGGLTVVVNAELLREADWLRQINGRIFE